MDETQQGRPGSFTFRTIRGEAAGLDLIGFEPEPGPARMEKTLRTFLNTLNVIHQQEIDVAALGDAHPAVTRSRRTAALPTANRTTFSTSTLSLTGLIAFLEERSNILADLRSSIAHLFVDEYQDVDDRQERLIWLLSDGGRAPRVTVVGDDDQALYGFRGARVENMLGFEDRYPDVTIKRFERKLSALPTPSCRSQMKPFAPFRGVSRRNRSLENPTDVAGSGKEWRIAAT